MALRNALVSNWWSISVRMLSPRAWGEAKTSRPQRMEGVVRASRHARQTTLRLTVAHATAQRLRPTFRALAALPQAPLA